MMFTPLRKPQDHRHPRAAPLDGLEVRESSFGEWLAAGGERRLLPREPDAHALSAPEAAPARAAK